MSADLPPPCVSFGPVQSLIYLRAGDYFTADQMRAYATKAVASQAAELEALRADAERYRIWRHEFTGNESDEATPVIIALNDAWTPEAVDAVLDAARAALKEQAPNARLTGPKRPLQEYASGTE